MGGLSKVGVIGAGKMAGALLRGWIGSGVIKSNQVNPPSLIFVEPYKSLKKTLNNETKLLTTLVSNARIDLFYEYNIMHRKKVY